MTINDNSNGMGPENGGAASEDAEFIRDAEQQGRIAQEAEVRQDLMPDPELYRAGINAARLAMTQGSDGSPAEVTHEVLREEGWPEGTMTPSEESAAAEANKVSPEQQELNLTEIEAARRVVKRSPHSPNRI